MADGTQPRLQIDERDFAPMDQLPPLTLPDQCFVNALLCLVLPVVRDVKEQELWRGIARDLRPQVTRNHRFVSRLVNSFAAWDMGGTPLDVEGARLRLLGELHDFVRWRCAAAYDRLSPKSER